MHETEIWSLSWKDTLKKEIAHSSILARIIPWTEEPGGLHSMGESDMNYRLNHQHNQHKVSVSSVTQLCPTDSATPWIAARQASLSITNSQSLLKLMPIESVMPSSHLILSSPSPPAPNPSQHQGLFQWINSSHEVAKILEFQLQHQSFQWTPRTDLL